MRIPDITKVTLTSTGLMVISYTACQAVVCKPLVCRPHMHSSTAFSQKVKGCFFFPTSRDWWVTHARMHTNTYIHTAFMATVLVNLGKPAPERLNHSGFYLDDGVSVASAGPYANHSHLAPDR